MLFFIHESMAKYLGKSLKSMLRIGRKKYPKGIEFKELLARDKPFAAAVVRDGYRLDFYTEGVFTGKKPISSRYDTFDDTGLELFVTEKYNGATITEISLEDQSLAKALWERE